MQQLTPEEIGRAIIPFFLRSLMKLERERKGVSKQSASAFAKWSQSTWGHLERETRSLQPHHWANISKVLNLSADHEVRRLNAFIGKHSQLWLQTNDENQFEVLEKTLTSPKAIRADDIIFIDLNASRPALFYELSRYSSNPDELIQNAKDYGMLQPRFEEQPPPTFVNKINPQMEALNKKEQIIEKLNNNVSDNKLRLLLRIMDKFEKYPADTLAHAYQHFSLYIKNK